MVSVEFVVEGLLLDRGAAAVGLLPGDGEAGATDGGEEAAEGLELVFVVAGRREAVVKGEEAFVEDRVVGGSVAGVVVGPHTELAVSGNVDALADALAVCGAAPGELGH